jgi:hypothetical protein
LLPRSLGRTYRKTGWWAPIDKAARGEPTLEVVLPEKAPLTELPLFSFTVTSIDVANLLLHTGRDRLRSSVFSCARSKSL